MKAMARMTNWIGRWKANGKFGVRAIRLILGGRENMAAFLRSGVRAMGWVAPEDTILYECRIILYTCLRFFLEAARPVFWRLEYYPSLFGDVVRASGRVKIEMRGPDGRLKCLETVQNLVVTTGLQHVADQMSDQGNAAMSHMAVGTGTTAAAAGQTALVTELDRNALDSTTQSGAGVIYVCTWAAGDGTGALTEAGIFNQAGAGVMLCRTVFSVKNKGAGDSMTLTWTITFS